MDLQSDICFILLSQWAYRFPQLYFKLESLRREECVSSGLKICLSVTCLPVVTCLSICLLKLKIHKQYLCLTNILATVDETISGSVRTWSPVLLYHPLSPQACSGLNMATLTAVELNCSELYCIGTLMTEKHCPTVQDLVGKSLHRDVADDEGDSSE